jgi:hypothetical protein
MHMRAHVKYFLVHIVSSLANNYNNSYIMNLQNLLKKLLWKPKHLDDKPVQKNKNKTNRGKKVIYKIFKYYQDMISWINTK